MFFHCKEPFEQWISQILQVDAKKEALFLREYGVQSET